MSDEEIPLPTDGELNHDWQVEVHGGDTDKPVEGPVRFGTPQVDVSLIDPANPDVEREQPQPTGPLVYGPVAVRSIQRELMIETRQWVRTDQTHVFSTRNTIHRYLTWIDVEFDAYGYIRFSGWETRKDGTMVSACWDVTPYRGEDEEGER